MELHVSLKRNLQREGSIVIMVRTTRFQSKNISAMYETMCVRCDH